MAKVLRSLINRTLFRGKGNLISLEDPYPTLTRLLAGHEIRCILDAGASDGRISRRLVERFPGATSYMFEPNPAYEASLKALCEADARYQPRYMALSDQAGEMTLNITADAGNTSLYEPSDRMADLFGDRTVIQQRVPVPVVTIDQWAEEEGVGPIQLMKLDIQAGELAALRGARRTLDEQVLAIYTEVCFNPLYDGGALFSQIDQQLRESGFLLYNIYGPRQDERGLLLWANAIFVHGQRLGL